MIEDIVSAIWEIIKSLILDIIFQIVETVICNIGRLSLLLVTLGKYPKISHLEKHYNRICLTGGFVIFIKALALAPFGVQSFSFGSASCFLGRCPRVY